MGTKAAGREGQHSKNNGLDARGATEKEEVISPSWDDGGGRYQISFAVGKSRRYHEKMASYYQSWTDRVAVANAVIGLSAFLALFGGKDSLLAQILVGSVTVAATITAALKPARKAKLHTDLQRRFTDLASQMSARVATDANLRWAKAQREKIEKDELPVYRLIDLQARNEECGARGGGEEDMVPLSRVQRCFGYLADFDMQRLEEWRSERIAADP